MAHNRKALVTVFLTIFILAMSFFGSKLLRLEDLYDHQLLLKNHYFQSPILTTFLFASIYIFWSALSLPGATLLTLAAGAIFGFWIGLVIVCIASNIGALLAFLISRFLLRDLLQEKMQSYLTTINQGIQRDGAFYLFALRIIPTFPFFIVNAAMGLTLIPTRIFSLVSFVGMLPMSAIYINAGTHLATVKNTSDLLSPGLFFSFLLIGLLPIILKFTYSGFKKAKKNPQ